MQRYVVLAAVWTAIAVVLDYPFVLWLLKPADGYYRPDVYAYYALTFLLPLAVVRWKRARG